MEELLRGLSKEEREFLLNALASCKNETEIREVLSGANLSATAAQVRMILERVLGGKKRGRKRTGPPAGAFYPAYSEAL